MSLEKRELLELKDWKFSVDIEGISWAILDREGESANSLGRRVLNELATIVDHVEQGARDKRIRGMVFMSGKPNSCIVGADIREFDSFANEADVMEGLKPVLDLFDRIEAMPVPVIAAVHGVCVGGGLELILACHWRIATRDDKTRVGFPEVKLGIFPGFHGTVRSIRQAGPMAAMQAMLTGRMIRATATRGMGLIDELARSPQNLRWAARKAVLRKRRAKPAGRSKRLMTQWPARGLLASQMRKATAAKVREDHYPAPFRLIDLFEKHGGDLKALRREETRAFAPLMVSETSRNLRRVYLLSEQLKNQAPKDKPFKPLRAHIIGAGTMGADIAGWCVVSGMEVTLQDLSSEVIDKGIKAQGKLFNRKFKTKALRAAAKSRLVADPNGKNISRADIVIEAIVEKLEVKQGLFRDIEPKLKPGAVMATNTSSILIEDIAEGLRDPGRLIGIHFFNPVAMMPLVEIVYGKGTSEDEVNKGCGFVTAINKFPLKVKSSPGFLVNRVLAPYMMSAMGRMQKGLKQEVIDEAARAFGMPMGPIELADSVGLDVCKHVGEILGITAEGSKLENLVATGKLGKKTGRGFYLWKDGKAIKAKVEMGLDEQIKLSRELVEPLIAECQKALDEGVVSTSDLVDAGVIFGTGFAPFRGGPLHFKNSEGATETHRAAAE